MSQTKKVLAAAGGFLTLVIVVSLVMPKDKIDQISLTYKRLVGDAGVACLDYKRKDLKDPDSAKLLDADTSTDNSTSVVSTQITYVAKNSYGAFVSSKAKCLIFNGTVDEKLTTSQQKIDEGRMEIDKDLQNLQDSIACYDKLAEYRKQGKRVTDADGAACVPK
jgi:hypothetical protein